MNSASSANHDKIQQESIPGGFALPAHHRTGGFSVQRGLPEETLLGTETAWTETALGLPLEGTRNQSARLEVTSYRDPLSDRQTLCPKLCLWGKTVWLPDVLCI